MEDRQAGAVWGAAVSRETAALLANNLFLAVKTTAILLKNPKNLSSDGIGLLGVLRGKKR